MKKITGLLASTAVALALTGGVASAEIKIGVLVPDSGPAGLFGPSTRNAAMLAAQQINAQGGINGEEIELIFADVGVPPAEASQAALRLWKGDGVAAFVGMHDSAVREALLGRFNGQVPYVYTPVYEGKSCASGLYVTGETPSQQLAPVIPYLMEAENVSKWYLIGHDYNWPRDTNALAKEYIAKAGGEVVGEEYVPFTVAEFDSSLQRIRESGADAVLITLVGGGSVGFNVSFAGFGLDDQAIRLGTLIEENTLAGIGADNAGRSAAVDALINELAHSPRFDVVVPVSAVNYVDSSLFDTLMPWDVAEKICDDVGAQAIVSLEAFDSDSSMDVDREERTEYVDGKERTYSVFTATRTTDVLTAWRIYDPSRKALLDDQRNVDWSMSWSGEGRSRQEAINDVPVVHDTVKYTGQGAGASYGQRIAPHYVVLHRPYFVVGKDPRFKQARDYVLAQLWDDAANLWYEVATTDPDPMLRGKASHNLAVYYEVQGDLGNALGYAQQAVADFPKGTTIRYLGAIQQRIGDTRRVNEQMAPVYSP